MKYINRTIEQEIIEKLQPNKVVIIFGTRRVGKTELIKKVAKSVSEDYLLLNGEDMEHASVLEQRSTASYKRLLGGRKLLIIDEAQGVPEIGLKLKLMVDTIKGLKIIATGSSSFDLINRIGEPLVGRKTDFLLLPLAQMEFSKEEDFLTTKSNLEERLIFGGYPELIHLPQKSQKTEYLKDLINSYLLKDLIAFEGIKKREKIIQLLRIIAFRTGSEISVEGIGNQLQMSKNTVDRYLDLLSKVFIIHKLTGFSRNLDNEIAKKSKWYFYDNGIRNAIVSDFKPLNLRDDIGRLWENYLVSERIKFQTYNRIQVNNYFWRTHSKKEIDWVEEDENGLRTYEFKWSQSQKAKQPALWKKAYPGTSFEVVTPENYLGFIE